MNRSSSARTTPRTIVKRRYLESYPLQKLFEVYYLKHMEEDRARGRGSPLRAAGNILPEYDVVSSPTTGTACWRPKRWRSCAARRGSWR